MFVELNTILRWDEQATASTAVVCGVSGRLIVVSETLPADSTFFLLHVLSMFSVNRQAPDDHTTQPIRRACLVDCQYNSGDFGNNNNNSDSNMTASQTTGSALVASILSVAKKIGFSSLASGVSRGSLVVLDSPLSFGSNADGETHHTLALDRVFEQIQQQVAQANANHCSIAIVIHGVDLLFDATATPMQVVHFVQRCHLLVASTCVCHYEKHVITDWNAFRQ
jgi:hypothetical protein